MATKTLTGAQCDEITCIRTGSPYKTGQRAIDGATFNSYRFDGTVFTVESSNPFCKDFENGRLATVKLIEGTRLKTIINEDGSESEESVPSFEFDSHTSMQQEMNRAKHEYQKKAFANLATQPVTDEFLAQLLNG